MHHVCGGSGPVLFVGDRIRVSAFPKRVSAAWADVFFAFFLKIKSGNFKFFSFCLSMSDTYKPLIEETIRNHSILILIFDIP